MKRTLYTLGKIVKTHGYNGIVTLVSERPLEDEAEDLDEVFVNIDGLYVPFSVKKFALLTDTSAHVQLEFVNNQNEALILTGCKVCTAIPHLKKEPETGLEWIGFTVVDSKHGKVGEIKQIEDYKGNIVIQITNGDKEILISMYPELITNINNDAKILYIAAPDGYFSG